MKRKVKESFWFAADGVNATRMKAGREYEFSADAAARFEAEGYLEPVPQEAIERPKRVRRPK